MTTCTESSSLCVRAFSVRDHRRVLLLFSAESSHLLSCTCVLLVRSHRSLQGPTCPEGGQGDLWPWALTMAASLVMYYEDIRNDSTKKDENPVIKIMNYEAAQCGITVETLRACGKLIREHYKSNNERNAIRAGVTDVEHLQLQMQYLSSHMGSLKEAAQFGFSQATQQLAVVNRTNELQTEEIAALRAEMRELRHENAHYLQRILATVDTLSQAFGVLSVSGSPISSNASGSPSLDPGSPLSQQTHSSGHRSPVIESPAPAVVGAVEAGDGSRQGRLDSGKHNFSDCLTWTVADLLYNVAIDNVRFENNTFPPGLSGTTKSDSQLKNKAKCVVELARSTASTEQLNELGTMQLRMQRASNTAIYNTARFEVKRITMNLHKQLYEVLYGHCIENVWGAKRVLEERRNKAMHITVGKMYNTYQKQVPTKTSPSGLLLTTSGLKFSYF